MNLYAINSIGNCYKIGCFGKRDYAQVLKYYERSAKLNNPESFYKGYLYLTGHGVKQDLEKVNDYITKAENLNHASSYRLHAFHRLLGEGVKQNYEIAKECYLKAIELNNNDSFVSLAFLYYFGHSVEKDYQKALELFWIAANKNIANGYFN